MKDVLLHYYKKYMYFIGYAGQFIYLIQAHRIWITKSCADVSFIAFFVSFIAVASMALYGYLIKDNFILKTYIFGTAAAAICLIMMIAYSK